MLKLFGHDQESHDPLAGGELGFDETLVQLWRRQQSCADYQLELVLCQRNLGQFHRLFNLAIRLMSLPAARPIEPFEPAPLTRLRRNFDSYVARMREAIEGTRLRLSGPEPSLLELLAHVENRATLQNQPELLRLLGLLTEGAYIGPRTFHLDLSNACNENCTYCWFHSPSAKNRLDAATFDRDWSRQALPHQKTLDLVDDLARLHTVEDVLLTGKGEPLTHPTCLDIVDYIKRKKLTLTLFSNGVLLPPATTKRLHEAGLDLLYVSLSSASEETYERQHPGHPASELETVRKNLLALRDLKQASGKAVPKVVMVDVINHDNAHEVAEFARWSAEVGAELLRYQLIHVQYYNEALRLTEEDLAKVREGLARAREVAEAAGMKIVPNVDYQMETLDAATGAWGRNELPGEGCFVGWYFSRVWADGTVSFCCSPKPIGNLRNESFLQMWRGVEYARYRSSGKHLSQNHHVKFVDGTPLVNNHCFGCPNYEGLGEARRGLREHGLERWLPKPLP
jgi:MoaA/NifB/PqqE/SkfB family radical SAM enzyme